MPELPEVEVTRRMMEPVVTHRRVERVVVMRRRTVRRHESSDEFVELVEGARIEDVRRRAKYIVCLLSTGRSLVMHFGLNGFLQLVPVTPNSGVEPPALPKGTRAVFVLGGQADRLDSPPVIQARFVDPRTIGQLFVPPNEGPGSLDELLEQLGPEPLDDAFTAELLAARLNVSTAKIKGRLLDQSVVAGLGNIYTDEALFAAGIRPDRPADQLNPTEMTRLWEAIRLTLKEAIRRESLWVLGAKKSSRREERRDGHHPEWPFSPIEERSRAAQRPDSQPALAVYRRTGEPCRVCDTPIERRRISGRSAHFCPTCQR